MRPRSAVPDETNVQKHCSDDIPYTKMNLKCMVCVCQWVVGGGSISADMWSCCDRIATAPKNWLLKAGFGLSAPLRWNFGAKVMHGQLIRKRRQLEGSKILSQYLGLKCDYSESANGTTEEPKVQKKKRNKSNNSLFWDNTVQNCPRLRNLLNIPVYDRIQQLVHQSLTTHISRNNSQLLSQPAIALLRNARFEVTLASMTPLSIELGHRWALVPLSVKKYRTWIVSDRQTTPLEISSHSPQLACEVIHDIPRTSWVEAVDDLGDFNGGLIPVRILSPKQMPETRHQKKSNWDLRTLGILWEQARPVAFVFFEKTKPVCLRG